jgi:hypothetical protein
MKEKTRKQTAAALIVTSVPLLYYGFSNLEAGASEPLEAIAISLGCTGGLGFFFGGLYMLFKKGRGENLLASQTSEDPPILDKAKIKRQNQKALKEFADKIRKETKEEIINKKQKVNEMATLTPAEKMNKLDELIEDDKALDKMKATNNKAQAEMRADIKEDGFEQNEDGIWVPIKKKPVA